MAESLLGDIFVPNLQGIPEYIEHHKPSTVMTAVGVTQAMDGLMTAQLAVLQAKAEEWAKSI